MTRPVTFAQPDWLGPASEARFAEAFSACVLITAKAAADLLGVDVKTLGALTEGGFIRAVRRGKLRAYTERDLRAYLIEDTEECLSTSPPAARSGNSISSSPGRGFTDRPARLRVVPQKPSSGKSA